MNDGNIVNHMVEFHPRRPDHDRQRERFLRRFWQARLDALERLIGESDTDEGSPDMSQSAKRDTYGVLIEPTTLKIERLLPGPVERVWAYLTDSDKRRLWLAAGDMTLKAGAPFAFVWRNDELSVRTDPRPAGFSEEHSMESRITEVDPPRLLSFTWQGSGDVTMELTPKGDEVLLTIVHRSLPDRDTLLKVAAGWHQHLDTLVDRATGAEPQPFWPAWRRLHEEYGRRLPA